MYDRDGGRGQQGWGLALCVPGDDVVTERCRTEPEVQCQQGAERRAHGPSREISDHQEGGILHKLVASQYRKT